MDNQLRITKKKDTNGKALVEDSEAAAYLVRVNDRPWAPVTVTHAEQCKIFDAEHPWLPDYEYRELIARPNLNAKEN